MTYNFNLMNWVYRKLQIIEKTVYRKLLIIEKTVYRKLQIIEKRYIENYR
jgi:hypothetical protein